MLRRIRSWLWAGRGDLPAFSDGVYDQRYINSLLVGLAMHLDGDWGFQLWVDGEWQKKLSGPGNELHVPVFELIPFSGAHLGGWDRMMEIYSPEHLPRPGERILAVGLDTIITGPIDWLFEWAEAPCGFIADPYQPDTISNSVMTFDHEGARILWEAYQEALETKFEGLKMFDRPSEMMLMRKVWEQHRWPLLEDMPSRLLSYKAHSPHVGASVVYFHGSPKPHELSTDTPLGRLWHET